MTMRLTDLYVEADQQVYLGAVEFPFPVQSSSAPAQRPHHETARVLARS